VNLYEDTILCSHNHLVGGNNDYAIIYIGKPLTIYILKEVTLVRKSRYTIAFPVRDKYILINGLSGVVRLISKECAQKFFDGDVTEELKPFFTHLTPEEEFKKAKFLCDFLMKNAAQCADGSIAVTYDCNLRCPYCYEIWAKPSPTKIALDKNKVDKAFEALEILNKECTRKKPLNLTGGEPLMKKNKEIVTYILKKGDDLGYHFTIFTNGVEFHHFLSDLSSVDITSVQITLDGPRHFHDTRRIFKKGKGTFDVIVRNIEEARVMGLPLSIRTNTDPEILSHVDELAHFYKERAWINDPHMRFALVHLCGQYLDPEKSDEITKIYKGVLDAARKPELNFFSASPNTKLNSLFSEPPQFWPSFWNCNAVTNRYVFDPFGDVYPCRTMLGWKEERIGRYIPELSFNERYKKWKSRTLFNMEKCTQCTLALVCGGDCGYASLLHKKDLLTPVCSTTEKIVIAYLEYLYDRKCLKGQEGK
jgi:uncharacterized protein